MVVTRKRSHWGDDERATVGSDHRRRAQSMSEAQQDVSDGTPESDELPADAELTGPSERIMADPVACELWAHIENVARRGVQRHRNASDRIAQVHADAGNQHLGSRVARVEKQLRWWQGIALAALTAAGGSLFAVAKGLYERGEKEGRSEIRLEVVERTLEQHRIDIRELRDRSGRRVDPQPDRAGWVLPAPTQTPKVIP